MTDRKMRSLLRWSHLAFGLSVAAYLYSPLRTDAFATTVMQFLMIPFLGLTGVAMWQQLGTAKFSDTEE